MKLIRTEDAAGQVLCHDITQIIPGEFKGARFRKGHIIQPEDIPVLLSIGKENLYVWEKKPGILHEDEAAALLYKAAAGKNIHGTEPKEGKIELIADCDGLLKINREALLAVNRTPQMMIATIHSDLPVKKGQKLAGTRIIPLVIEQEKMDAMQAAAGSEPILNVLPMQAKKFAVITTGSEVFKGRIEDKFTPILVGKLAERLGAAAEDILSFELCAYCHEPAQLVGFEQDLLSSARLDNLTSVHACLRGLLDADGDTINLAVLYDNEEIGSNTRRGADSSTLTVILEKLADALVLSRAQYLDACVNGMLLSCDAAHAVHPNHPELADVTCGALLGRGVALKRSPRYSSDADTCAVISGLCDAANIPLQTYMNRADLPGGSTVGSMASSLLAMPAADIGVPLLRELMAAADQDAFVRLCTAFYSAK